MAENILPTSTKNIIHGIGKYPHSGKEIIYRSEIRVSPHAAVERGVRAPVRLHQAHVGAEEDLVLAHPAALHTVSPDHLNILGVIPGQDLRGCDLL